MPVLAFRIFSLLLHFAHGRDIFWCLLTLLQTITRRMLRMNSQKLRCCGHFVQKIWGASKSSFSVLVSWQLRVFTMFRLLLYRSLLLLDFFCGAQSNTIFWQTCLCIGARRESLAACVPCAVASSLVLPSLLDRNQIIWKGDVLTSRWRVLESIHALLHCCSLLWDFEWTMLFCVSFSSILVLTCLFQSDCTHKNSLLTYLGEFPYWFASDTEEPR